MNLESILREQQEQIETSKLYRDKFDIQNNIIQINILSDDKYNSQYLYRDLKSLFRLYILAVEERSYGYDSIERAKIKEYLELLPINQRVSLIRFFGRLLKNHGFEDEVKWIAVEADKAELINLASNFKLKSTFKLLYLAITYNYVTLISSLLFCISVEYLLLLPAPGWSNVIFEVSYDNYNAIPNLNRLLNIFAGLFGVNEDFKVLGINWVGVVMIVTGKIVYILLLLNILVKQLLSRINI